MAGKEGLHHIPQPPPLPQPPPTPGGSWRPGFPRCGWCWAGCYSPSSPPSVTCLPAGRGSQSPWEPGCESQASPAVRDSTQTGPRAEEGLRVWCQPSRAGRSAGAHPWVLVRNWAHRGGGEGGEEGEAWLYSVVMYPQSSKDASRSGFKESHLFQIRDCKPRGDKMAATPDFCRQKSQRY